MGPIELIEKVINEHGSATVLREHLGLVKAKYEALERECANAKAQVAQVQQRLDEEKLRSQRLQTSLDALKNGPLASQVCDHCASPRLRRTGTRPHPIIGDLGVREAILVCEDCGRTSHIEIPT